MIAGSNIGIGSPCERNQFAVPLVVAPSLRRLILNALFLGAGLDGGVRQFPLHARAVFVHCDLGVLDRQDLSRAHLAGAGIHEFHGLTKGAVCCASR